MNVGDYVRTKDGKIFKWAKYCTTSKEDYNEHTRKLLFNENEIKSSPQIIDLIQCGDYVNGYRVDFTNISEKLSYEDKCIGFYDGDGDINLFEEDIKSIVTHEQFENIEYRVEE